MFSFLILFRPCGDFVFPEARIHLFDGGFGAGGGS